MPTKKSTSKKTNLDKKVDKVREEAGDLKKEGKKALNRLDARWDDTAVGEKVSVIVGLILLIRGIRELQQFIRGVLLIVLGILGITKFFVRKK